MLEFWVILGLVVAAIVTGIGAVYTLAKINIFFTFVEEGTAKAIVKMGSFARAVMQYQDHYLTPNTWEVSESVTWGRSFGGLRWVGIWPFWRVYTYKFRWATLKISTEDGKSTEKLVSREEDKDYIFVKDAIYVVEMKSVESKGMVPLDFRILITARCNNPYKALFKIHDWPVVLANRIQPDLRVLVADQEYEELIRGKVEVKLEEEAEDEIAPLEETTEGSKFELDASHVQKEFHDNYGIDIVDMDIKSIDPSEEQRQMFREAATERWRAEQAAKKVKVDADAQKYRISTVYGQLLQYKDNRGVIIKFLETLEAAAQGPSNTIIPVGAIMDAARNFLGGRQFNASYQKMLEELADTLRKQKVTAQDLQAIIKTLKETKKGGKK